MSYPTTTRPETPDDYHDRLCEATPIPVMLWKTLKGLVEAALVWAIAHAGVISGADPGLMYPLAIVAAVGLLAGELKEVEIANATVRFKRNGGDRGQLDLDRLLDFVRTAGAPDESDTDRNGVLSYAAETHSVGYGLGLGAAIALNLSGVPYVLELVILALGGVTAKRRLGNDRVWREVTDEPQYFVAALALGFVVVGGIAAALGALPF